MKRSARLEKIREDSLAEQVLQLKQRIDTLDTTVKELQARNQHNAKDYRTAREEVLNHFTSSRSGPDCMVCCRKKAVPALPCTHMVCCIGCAVHLETCPVCRAKIEDVVIRRSPAFKAPLFCLQDHV